MKALHCPGCDSHLEVKEGEKVLICQYCNTEVHNEYYNESAEEEYGASFDDSSAEDSYITEESTVDEDCVSYLLDLTGGEDVGDAEGVSYTSGEAMDSKEADRARRYFEIPDEEDIYFIYDNGSHRGFAMCEGGIFYCDDDAMEPGVLTWAQFIEDGVSYQDSDLYFNDIRFEVPYDVDILGDFLIEFHDQIFDMWYDE